MNRNHSNHMKSRRWNLTPSLWNGYLPHTGSCWTSTGCVLCLLSLVSPTVLFLPETMQVDIKISSVSDLCIAQILVSLKTYAALRGLVWGSSHNNLRISRLLKCLSEFGLEHLNAGFLLHILNEQSEFNELNSSGIRGSMDRWWANCLRNDEEREWVGGIIKKVRTGSNEYVFTREMYERALARRTRTGSLREDDTIALSDPVQN